MAVIGTEDLQGAPTSGTFDPGEHGPLLATQPSSGGTNQAGRISYASGYTLGYSAIRFDGAAGYCWLQVLLGGRERYRLRIYARKSGEQSSHHFVFRPSGGGQNDNAVNVGSGYDAQVRNVSGTPWHNRYNFASAGTSASFADDTWWRAEYEFVNESHPDLDNGGVVTGDGVTRMTGGALLELWYDPDDTGPPDYSTWAAGAGDATRLLIGNTNQTSGVELFAAHLAASDGERLGPFTPPEPPSGQVLVKAGGVMRAGHVAGVVIGGVLRDPAQVGVVSGGIVRPLA